MNNDTNPRNQATAMSINSESFLEMLQSIKSIQQNQQIFQQEIMHLKMLNPPLQQHMFPGGGYNLLPQNQAQIPVSNT